MSFCASARNRLKMDAELFRSHFQQCDLVVQALHGYLSTIAPTEAVGVAPFAKLPTTPIAAKIAKR
jgi:hypothetical protein